MATDTGKISHHRFAADRARIELRHRQAGLVTGKFDQLERRVDYAEGRADAIAIGNEGPPSLSDEIAALEGQDAIDDELEEMKKLLGKPGKDD